MDLSGFGLDEDTQVKIAAAYDEDIKALKNKNSDLIERDKNSKAAMDGLAAGKLAAEQEKHDIAKASAEKDNNLIEYKQALENEKKEMSNLTLQIQKEKNDRLVGDQSNTFSKSIADDPASQQYMTGLFQSSVEVVDGEVRPRDLSKTMEQLVDGIVTDDANKRYIKANVGSGSGSNGSNNGGSASTVKANFDGNQQERTSAAVKANPKLASLPIR